MDLASAAFYIYLLFIPLKQWPVDFEKKVMPKEESEFVLQYKKNELRDFLSLAELYKYDNIIDLNESASLATVYYTDSLNRLKSHEIGEERFSISQGKSDNYSYITVNNDIIVRKQFDSSNNLINKDVWKNGSNLDSSTLIQSIRYSYEDSIIKRIDNYTYTDNTFTEIEYDDNGNPVKVILYDISENQKSIKSKSVKKFDEQNRIVLENISEYIQVTDEFRRGKKKTKENTRRYEYEYTDYSDTPNMKYYENDVLRIMSIYNDIDSYEEILYFDGNYSIKTVYVDGIKTLEIVYMNGKETRRRIIE